MQDASNRQNPVRAAATHVKGFIYIIRLQGNGQRYTRDLIRQASRHVRIHASSRPSKCRYGLDAPPVNAKSSALESPITTPENTNTNLLPETRCDLRQSGVCVCCNGPVHAFNYPVGFKRHTSQRLENQRLEHHPCIPTPLLDARLGTPCSGMRFGCTCSLLRRTI